MRTETIKLYTINELSPEAKEKALDKYRDWNTDHDWYKEYESLTSDECIAESLEANEVEFLENGTRF